MTWLGRTGDARRMVVVVIMCCTVVGTAPTAYLGRWRIRLAERPSAKKQCLPFSVNRSARRQRAPLPMRSGGSRASRRDLPRHKRCATHGHTGRAGTTFPGRALRRLRRRAHWAYQSDLIAKTHQHSRSARGSENERRCPCQANPAWAVRGRTTVLRASFVRVKIGRFPMEDFSIHENGSSPRYCADRLGSELRSAVTPGMASRSAEFCHQRLCSSATGCSPACS